MLLKRKVSSISDCCNDGPLQKKRAVSNKLFQPGVKLTVTRAPVLTGLSVPAALQKKFQRPSIKRRAYGKSTDIALKQSSLGPKKRMNGMQKLLARAGRGLTFQIPQQKNDPDDTASSDSDSEEEGENDRPFEPLCVWKSPHQPTPEGGEPASPKGLPLRTQTVTRTDEYGVEETVQVLTHAPLQEYAKEHVFVPPVLAKWLRPHQREGVQFLYECVMGLKDYPGRGCILADGTYPL